MALCEAFDTLDGIGQNTLGFHGLHQIQKIIAGLICFGLHTGAVINGDNR